MFDSVEDAERFEAHLKSLSEMSNREKREYAKILDAKEKRTETIGKRKDEISRDVTRRAIIREGLIGVHRSDLTR